MKTINRLVSILLIVTIISSGTLTATASDTGHTFKDVPANSWFYEFVQDGYTKGIVRGYDDGLFHPYDTVSKAQALTMLARILNIKGYTVQGSYPWYYGLQLYIENNTIIDVDDWNAPALRKDIAHYIFVLFEFYKSNDIVDLNSVPVDMFSDTDSLEASTLGYLGISAGVPMKDGTVAFLGDKKLTRAEAITFLLRSYTYGESIRNRNLDDVYSVVIPESPSNPSETGSKSTAKQLIAKYHSILDSENKLPEWCDTSEDLIKVWRYLIRNGISSATVKTHLTDRDSIMRLMSNHDGEYNLLYSFNRNTPTCYSQMTYIGSLGAEIELNNSPGAAYSSITLKIKWDAGDIQSKLKQTDEYIHSIIESMYADGTLSESMSIEEKAKAICTWMAYKYEYDTTYSKHTIYDLMTTGSGVCSAYTSLYYELCRHAGINIISQTGDAYSMGEWGGHAWSAILDCEDCGSDHYIDVTWCDPIPNRPNYVNLKYFWLDHDTFFKDHILEGEC